MLYKKEFAIVCLCNGDVHNREVNLHAPMLQQTSKHLLVTETAERSNFEAMMTIVVCEVAPVTYRHLLGCLHHVPYVQVWIHLQTVMAIISTLRVSVYHGQYWIEMLNLDAS